mgnify:CR=1 FL=1
MRRSQSIFFIMASCLVLTACYVGSSQWLLEAEEAFDFGQQFRVDGDEPFVAIRDGAWYRVVIEAEDEPADLRFRFVDHLAEGATLVAQPCPECRRGTFETRSVEADGVHFVYGQFVETAPDILSVCLLSSEGFYQRWSDLAAAEADATSARDAADQAFLGSLFEAVDPNDSLVTAPPIELATAAELDRLMEMASPEGGTTRDRDYLSCEEWALHHH